MHWTALPDRRVPSLRRPDTSWVYVDVGLGFHAQMTPAEAISFSTQRESKLTEAAEARPPVENSRPEASASSPSSTPHQRQTKLRATSSLGQPRPMGRDALAGRPYHPALFLLTQALTQRAAKLKAQIKLTIGAIDEILAGRVVQGR